MHTGSRGAEILAVDVVPCTQTCSRLTVSWRRSIRLPASTAAPASRALYARSMQQNLTRAAAGATHECLAQGGWRKEGANAQFDDDTMHTC
jgi:hypothetical protein